MCGREEVCFLFLSLKVWRTNVHHVHIGATTRVSVSTKWYEYVPQCVCVSRRLQFTQSWSPKLRNVQLLCVWQLTILSKYTELMAGFLILNYTVLKSRPLIAVAIATQSTFFFKKKMLLSTDKVSCRLYPWMDSCANVWRYDVLTQCIYTCINDTYECKCICL